MRLFSRAALVIGTILVSSAVGYAIGHADLVPDNMNRAVGDLQAAQRELEVNTLDYGGHRLNALNLVNQAIVEAKASIAATAARPGY